MKPIKKRRGAAIKYAWDELRAKGWIFVPLESGHANQGASLRSAARSQGLRISAHAATYEGRDGFMVEIRP